MIHSRRQLKTLFQCWSVLVVSIEVISLRPAPVVGVAGWSPLLLWLVEAPAKESISLGLSIGAPLVKVARLSPPHLWVVSHVPVVGVAGWSPLLLWLVVAPAKESISFGLSISISAPLVKV